MARTPFTDEENDRLSHELGLLVKREGSQGAAGEAMGGIRQQTIQKLLIGASERINWSLEYARRLMTATGQTFESVIGRNPDIRQMGNVAFCHSMGSFGTPLAPLPNLEQLLVVYRKRLPWSPWTVAAARAGIYGPDDLDDPLGWKPRLDALEARLARLIKEILGTEREGKTSEKKRPGLHPG